MAEEKYLGVGMKFPPRVNPATGRFMMAEGAQSVRDSVYLILMTQRGERWLEPDFGSGLMGYTFIDTSATILGVMRSELTRAILEQEPRIADVQLSIDPTERADCLMIDIQYMIAGGNTPENLVFPFYLNAVPLEEEDYE